MSEPQKRGGDPSLFSSIVKGEKARGFEDQFPDVSDQEVVEAAEPEEAEAGEVQAEEAAEVSGAEQEAEVDEDLDDAARLVKEASERLRRRATEQAAPTTAPETARLEGRIQELKDQIVQMGRAQDVPEPEDGFDVSVLDSPAVREHLRAARESDDPGAEAKALAVIAQHVYESKGKSEVAALRKELDGLREATQQEQRRQQNQQMFQAGLVAAAKQGKVEYALAKEFVENREIDAWNAHIAQHGATLEGYTPKSVLGAWLMQHPEFMATPTLMQAGTTLLAQNIRGHTGKAAPAVSTTGAAAPVRGGKPKQQDEGDVTEEDRILAGILNAAKEKKQRSKVFGA